MARLPVYDFLRRRLQEYDPNFEVREGTGWYNLFMKPVQFILEPLINDATYIRFNQSFLKILQTSNPDAYSEDAVDALTSNFFVERNPGGYSGGVARVYYSTPVDREWPENGIIISSGNGQVYTNPNPFIVTEREVAANLEEGLYFYDIPVVALERGEDANQIPGNLVSVSNDAQVVRVTNPAHITGGRARETNTELINRTKASIAVRDLVTGKGFNATLFENFSSFIKEISAIGFGDPEMMRDIVYNAHIGGKVDGYIKTQNISIFTEQFIGLDVDTTRQSRTSKNIQLTGTAPFPMGNTDIDRSNGKDPVIRQVKPAYAAEYISTVDMSSPIDLSTNQYIGLVIDGEEKTIRVAGATPAATSRNEIVNKINSVFGLDVAEPVGSTFKVMSLIAGLDSQITIKDPATGTSALLEVFGLAPGDAYVYKGDGPITFVEGLHYSIDDEEGTVQRIVGSVILGTQITGETTEDGYQFLDNSIPTIFDNVAAGDILTIQSGDDAGDYRVVEVNTGSLTLDVALTVTATDIEYSIRRTGIKNGELLYVEYYFNPIAIDIGKYILLNEDTQERGIRPGRDLWTITNVPFIRVREIRIIEPLTLAPTGDVLEPSKGWGSGVYGGGPYGVGTRGDYRMVVNKPHERFSVFEDSYIVISNNYNGYSIEVEYEAVPELEAVHEFSRSNAERVLGSDILIKHFLPAYVSGTIEYKVDGTDSTIPDNASLQTDLKAFISSFTISESIEYSDIIQYILRRVDPFDRFGGYVRPFTLKATILNADGSVSIITGSAGLEIPVLDPFPKETSRPLSPKIVHWIGDEITLVRL